MRSLILLIVFLVTGLGGVSIAETWEDDPDQHTLVDAKFRRWRAETPFGSYQPRKTRTLSLLAGYTRQDDQQLCEFGGRADLSETATGYFRTEKIQGRWWLIDPHGHPYFSTSLNSIRPGLRKDRNPTTLAAFDKRWMNRTAWAEEATRFLRDTGFNTVGTWSDDAMQKVDSPLPWTTVIYVMYPFGAQRGAKADESNMKFPNECMPIFDPAFDAFCEQKIEADVTDEMIQSSSLIGYFVDNELPWRSDALDRYLQIDTTDVNYTETAAWLSRRKQRQSPADVDSTLITDADRADFLAHIADLYFSAVSRSLRKRDPNHLYLGSRLHGQAVRLEPIFRVAGKYADVVSVNYYNRWTPRESEIDNWPIWSADKPFLISEWYAKGDDSGYKNIQGAGMVVRTQADRGRYYQNFLLRLLESKSCIGSYWHTYRDAREVPVGSNKGFVNVSFEPYGDLVDSAAEINRAKYSVIDFLDR